MLVFGLYSPSAKETLLRKQVEIVDGVALLLFTNADTRDLPVGSYKYNLRIVTNPEYNAEGFVICADATDNVMSIYNDLPKIFRNLSNWRRVCIRLCSQRQFLICMFALRRE